MLVLSTIVARRDAVRAAGGFDATLPVMGCEDWDLWLRLARRGAFAGVPEPLVRYRRHAANTARVQILASAKAVIARRWADPDFAAAAGIGLAAVRALHLWWHAAALAPDARGDALRTAGRALAAAPATVCSRPALHALAALARPGRRPAAVA